MLNLFRESVVLQGILTIGLWGVASYLMLTGQSVPEMLALGCGAVIAFWFQSKSSKQEAQQFVEKQEAVAKSYSEVFKSNDA